METMLNLSTRIGQIIVVSTILILCVSGSLLAGSPDQLIKYYNEGDYSTLITSAKTGVNPHVSIHERFLIFKARLKEGNLEKAEKILKILEKDADWDLTPTILSEKLSLYSRKPSKTDLFNLLAGWADNQKSPFMLKRFKDVLTEIKPNETNRVALRKTVVLMLKKFPELKEDTDILRVLLSTMASVDKNRKKVLADLWAYSDVSESDPVGIIDTGYIEKDVQTYKEAILTHFKKQKRYGNHSYITKNISTYLAPTRTLDRQIFDQLSQIYFYSMTRKRKYSHLIKVISSEKGRRYFRLSIAEARQLEFDLWIKKGHGRKGLAILNRLKKLDRRFDPNDMHLALADFYFQHGKYRQSLKYYQLVKTNGLSAETIADIQWNLFVMHNQQNRLQELKKIARWADKYQFDLPGNAAKFCYWGCKLKLYKNRDPIVCYQRYPFTYYGLKALHLNDRSFRIRSKVYAALKKKKQPQVTNRDSRLINFASMLYAINELEAADALIVHYMRKNNQLNIFVELAELLVNNQRYHLLQILGYGYYGDVLDDNSATTRMLLPYFYPAGYDGHVSRLSRQFDVPKTLIWSVMREESHFQPDVVSDAGAVGLMQLMPKTALFVGKTIRKKVKLDSLTDPATNMHLGTAYLRRLLKRYKGNFYFTLAAYNGGATNVKRWRKKTGIPDEDHFVEKISFNETKSYVKRVMRSYYLYENLYAQNR